MRSRRHTHATTTSPGASPFSLTRSLLSRHYLREADGTFAVTRRGAAWFAESLEIDVGGLGRARPPLARRCLDLTERQPHLAGGLGAAVTQAFLDRRHFTRMPGTRALRVTPEGTEWLTANGITLVLPAPTW